MLTDALTVLEEAWKLTVQVISGFLSFFLLSLTLQVTSASLPLGPRVPLLPLWPL